MFSLRFALLHHRVEYELLEAVQARLVIHPLTAPILGNDHNEFRSRESSVCRMQYNNNNYCFDS